MVARQAHNLEVARSNPASATTAAFQAAFLFYLGFANSPLTPHFSPLAFHLLHLNKVRRRRIEVVLVEHIDNILVQL